MPPRLVHFSYCSFGAAIDRLGSPLVVAVATAVSVEGSLRDRASAPAGGFSPTPADTLANQGATFMADYAKRDPRPARGAPPAASNLTALEDGEGDEVTFTDLSRGEAATCVAQNSLRPEWLVPMGLGADAFLASTEITHRVAVRRLRRPRDFARVNEVARALVAHTSRSDGKAVAS